MHPTIARKHWVHFFSCLSCDKRSLYNKYDTSHCHHQSHCFHIKFPFLCHYMLLVVHIYTFWIFLIYETLPQKIHDIFTCKLVSSLKSKKNTVYYISLYNNLTNGSKLNISVQLEIQELIHTELSKKLQSWKLSNTGPRNFPDKTRLPVAQILS
jgi:hypothetical protein